MAKNIKLTPAEWKQVIGYFDQMTPAELKREHIRQARQRLRAHPELADQIQPLLARYQQELRDMEAAE
jgi:hypothetical protein